jgi:hypothetical protein
VLGKVYKDGVDGVVSQNLERAAYWLTQDAVSTNSPIIDSILHSFYLEAFMFEDSPTHQKAIKHLQEWFKKKHANMDISFWSRSRW